MSTQSLEVREQLEQIIERDLLGPWDGPVEELPSHQGPRSRYLVGMIAPVDVRAEPEEVDSSLGDADEEGEGIERAAPAAASTMFPRSIGISFTLSDPAPALRVSVAWGRYEKRSSEILLNERGEPRVVWRRLQVEHGVDLVLKEGKNESPRWTDDPGVRLVSTCRRRRDRWVVELALVNRRKEPKRNRDEAWLFQASLTISAADGSPVFLPQQDEDLI